MGTKRYVYSFLTLTLEWAKIPGPNHPQHLPNVMDNKNAREVMTQRIIQICSQLDVKEGVVGGFHDLDVIVALLRNHYGDRPYDRAGVMECIINSTQTKNAQQALPLTLRQHGSMTVISCRLPPSNQVPVTNHRHERQQPSPYNKQHADARMLGSLAGMI